MVKMSVDPHLATAIAGKGLALTSVDIEGWSVSAGGGDCDCGSGGFDCVELTNVKSGGQKFGEARKLVNTTFSLRFLHFLRQVFGPLSHFTG